MKACRTCGVIKSLDEYAKHATGRDGHRNHCKSCQLVRITKWRNENRHRINLHQINYNSKPEGRAHLMFNAAQTRAKQQGKEFRLAYEDILAGISKGYCARTGIPFDFEMGYKLRSSTNFNPRSPSIDKIDAFGIYEPSNVQYVCTWYNMAKSQMTDAELLEFCKTLVEFNK